MTAFLLWLLATFDSAFIGYREAAGRNALINKRKYYLKAMLRGALFGQIAVVIVGLIILSLIILSAEPNNLIDELLKVGERMLLVYIPFATIIFLAFIIRTMPSVDLKSITSTVIFGPFTMLRPLVAVGGMIYGIFASPSLIILSLGILILLLMLGLERIICEIRRRKIIS